MVLNERNGCLQRLHRLFLVFDHNLLILLWHVDILSDHHVGTQPERQTHDKADTHLTYNLVFTLQSVFVAAEYLDIIIEESKESQPDRSGNHEDNVGVAHTTEQDDRNQDADDDDDTTHRRHTFLLYSEGIDLRIAFCLEILLTLHPTDKLLTKPS